MRTDCLFLLFDANFACQRVFGIRSKASFRMHFYSVPRAAYLVARRAPVIGRRQNANSVLTICLLLLKQ